MTHHRPRNRILGSIILATAGLFSATAMAAQFSTPPAQLSVTGVTISTLGYSAALSANGQVAILGGEGGTASTPAPNAVYVYTKSNGVWGNPVQLSQTGLAAKNNAGYSVALSANGEVALVGSPYSNTAYVYTESGGTWSAPVALSTSGFTPENFGTSVALSPDGKTAIVGDNQANSDAGAAYVYTFNGTAWNTGAALVPGGLSNAQYGRSVVLSSNGSTGLVALIGAPQSGAVYVSTYDGSSWSTPSALSTSGISGTAGTFGYSLALSANGQAAVIGSPFSGSGHGSAYAYTNSGGSWSAPTALTVPAGVAGFGWSVAMAPGGDEAFIASTGGSPNTGSVYALTKSGSSWSAPVQLSITGLLAQGGFGWAISTDATGQQLLVGAAFANSSAGFGYVYESPAAVALSVTPTPSPVVPGHTLVLDLSFNNSDTAGGGLPAVALTNLVLTDTLPAGVTYVSSNGANGTCGNSGGTVTCTLASLPPGTSSQNPWQPSITVTTPTTFGRLTNAVQITADEPLTGTSAVNTSILNDVTPTVTGGGVSTTPGQSVSGTLAVTPGYAGQTLSFTAVSQPLHGTLVLTASTGAFTYTPAAGFTGSDAFVFTAGDGLVTSNSAVEIITVSTTQYQAPVANNLSLTGYAGQPLTGQLSATSSNGHALTYTAKSQPAHGSVTVTASTGAFTYTPASGFTGSDSFTFTANDGTSTSNTATVTITVNPIPSQNSAPVAGSESLNDYAGQTLSGTLVAVSASGHALTYAVVTQPTQGKLTVTASTGAFTYTPTAGYTGSDAFTFTASDGTNTSNTATVNITVLAAPTAPPSSSGSSSGKSGGGAIGLATLALLGVLLLLVNVKKVNRLKPARTVKFNLENSTMSNVRPKHAPISFCGKIAFKAVTIISIGVLSATVMAAQFSAAPTALSINGVPGNQFLGYSMAISANGQILLVGGAGTTGDGAAFVYTRSNGVWSNPVMLSNTGLSSSDNLGAAVALSADGTVALVGAPGVGLAYIYTYANGTWSNPVALSTQGITPVRLGSSVALTPDGKTAFVGDPGASSNLGAMYVYTYTGTSWSSPTALPATGATGNQGLGSAIALSSNDLIALVGAVGAGTAWVYTNNGSTWAAPVKLPMTGTPPNGFGGAVALSSNGQTALVGASYPNSPPLAFVYTNPGTGWSNPTSLTTPTGAPFGNQFVALSPSGGTAFVGVAFTNQHQGAVYAFANTGGNWSNANAVLLSVSGVHPGDNVGSSIVLTANGQELLAGAVGANSNIGTVYDYQSPASVALAVTPSPTSVVPGHTLTLDLSFNNADTAGGGLPAVTLTNLVLTDTLPAGVTYVSSNGANGTCIHSGTTVTCTLASLPPGTSSQNPWQPSITVTTPATAGRLSNAATVSADEPLTGTSSVNTSILNDVTPTVTNGGVTTTPGTAVSGTLAATPGFSGQNLTFTITSQPTHGTVTLTNASTGAFSYTPAAGFTGTDVFIFEVGDGTVTSAPGAETVSVSTTQYQAPVANNLSLTGYAGQPLTGELSATSSNGHALTYTAKSQPAHGSVAVTASTGAFTYTPSSGYTGSDSFTFTANDGTSTSNTATVSITVSPIPTQNIPPVAGSESLDDYAGQALSGTLVATSSSGHTLTYAVQTQPGHGSVAVTASTGAFTYTPSSGYTGSDSFTFTANDGTSTSNTATVSITVNPVPSQGGAPVAGNETLSVYSGQTISGTLAAASASGHALTYTAASQPTHGSVTVTAATGAFTYTPAAGYTGSDSFTFTASDGTNTSNTATVSITVLAVPAASGGGATSSGKSGGGALGFPALLLFGVLLIAISVRKRRARSIAANTHTPLTRQTAAAHSNFQSTVRSRRLWPIAASCVALGCLLSTTVAAAVLSSAPVQLSDYGLQQGGLLGWTLALSPDGQVAAGGAVATNRSGTTGTDYTGAAYVYIQSNGTWSGPITLPASSVPTGAFLGGAIAVPSDTQVIVGAQNATAQGGVYVFTQTGGSWNNTPTVTPLALPSGMQGTYFGEGLAVSGNGQVLFVGTGPKTGTTTGDIYAYSLSGGTWGNPVALPMTGIATGTDMGRVLAASANGEVLVAGAPQVNGAYGAVYVWTKSGSTWNNPVALSLPSTLGPPKTLAFFGTAVAISADGTEILAGATGANNTGGAAYVYTMSGGTWSGSPVMLASPMANSNSFGNSVALSPDGATAFVGMPINSTGYVFLSTHANGAWSTPVALSTANLPVDAFVGTVLAQADNGEELLTSGETVNSNIGGLFVYDSPAAITLADSPSATALAPASSLTFNLSLTNADQPGTTPATTLNNVVLTDTLPAGVTYVSSNAANGNCSNSSGTVTCTLASLAPGNNSQNPWAPSITVKTPATASKLTNTVRVSANETLTGSSSASTQVTNDVTPAAVAGGVATTPSTAVSGTLSATPGFSGQSLTFAVVTPPGNGTLKLTNASTGAFTYTPNTGFNGTDVFIFNVGDGVVTSNSAAEVVTVSTTKIVPPVANDQTLSAVEGQTLDGQLSATSSNGHSLTYAATSQPVHGALSVTNSTGAFTYTPTSGFSGADSFTFTANDGTSTSNTATVNITVQATSTPPTTPPSSGGSSSGKSGGGGLGVGVLIFLGVLFGLSEQRKHAVRRIRN